MSALDPDNGCPDCGTTDTRHADYCSRAPRRQATGTRVLTTLPKIKAIGDPCNVCEGPCRFGNCPVCGGHSEHNWGCREAPAATAMGWDR
jgi:hypothetical protein